MSGCVAYQAKPVAPPALPARLAARQLGPHVGAWSEAELLAVALANSPQAAAAQARYATALAAAKAARQAPSASLTLTAEYSRQAGGDSPWLLGGITDFPLDVGARREARLTLADLTALQALYDYGEALWAVRVALAKATAQAAVGDSEVGLARRALDLRQQRLDRLDRRVEAGEDDRAIALLAQTDLFAAQRRLSDAQARQTQARVALATALGLPPAAVAGIQIQAAPAPAPTAADLASWRDEAALSRRDVLRAVADYDLAENALRLEVARQYPEVHLGPGYTWERGVNKVPFNLGLNLPPYDLNRANIAQAEAKRAEAGRSLEETQAAVLSGVDQAAAALHAARQVAAQVETRDLPAARASAALSERLAQAGEGDRADQLGAQAAAAEAELALLDADRNATLARVDLEDALRRAFDPRDNELLKARTAGDAR